MHGKIFCFPSVVAVVELCCFNSAQLFPGKADYFHSQNEMNKLLVNTFCN